MSDKTEDTKTVDVPKDIQSLSFEAALAQLEEIVQKLEGGSVELETSIEIYTRGQQLKAHCENKLSDARTRIDKIVVGADGSVSAQPANME